ncbi:MAG TPA: MarR family transcriptional regulator [Polyangiaceae bacterium]|jgi:DNA-binding MarR family transcriptional regulator|nr:MarR family transcriptional regulator [Polyangiaceae bacterium]
MSRPSGNRSELIEAIQHQARLSSTLTVLFHTAVAEHLGLNPSDHKVADIVALSEEPLTAGRLAELTGLTTGAITGVLDRLENAGFVVREHDPSDRRRIIVRLLPGRVHEVKKLFDSISSRLSELCSTYTTEQLSLVLDFMKKSAAVTRASAEELRERNASPAPRKKTAL